jgi:hypothetical protein
MGAQLDAKAATYTEQHKENKRIQTSMPRVGFEPTIPVFERAKRVHVLDGAATVIDTGSGLLLLLLLLLLLFLYSPLLGLGRFFSFLILYTVDKTPWTGDQLVARPLPTQNKRHPCLEWNSNP